MALVLFAVASAAARAQDVPRFAVDASWPKPLPNDWIMGQAAGVAVDAQDHVWVNADGTNNEVRNLRRENGEIVGAFGRNGRNAGEFHWVHNLAVDSKGNIYTTEVDTGKRAQKFQYLGPAVR